ncbi:DUF4148 domain-containing protein [Burkholderia glumae]|nr:DUF4148 domain-containing protein [Burkholderia glumae]MCM2481993.1 DUF4148 domain-containing protein [Burkholderia glumae]MCM2491409.1 DUF4148 domain-containing protein [Burkholderia glumae]MCM2507864.1 DUF4148 domain-containing protein [Burkholderia glumae]MCM2536431.1 DUF4148 domain-containing protein [Burkholderia glumae]MCM2542402.1 DUF4148 domain-containing protein [Burkholderia glumae]
MMRTTKMKLMKLAAAATLAAATLPALAQAAMPAGTQGAPAAATSGGTTNLQQDGWVAPYGQPVHQKTRAEVYQELVQAEQDGQLKYLNSTLYAH